MPTKELNNQQKVKTKKSTICKKASENRPKSPRKNTKNQTTNQTTNQTKNHTTKNTTKKEKKIVDSVPTTEQKEDIKNTTDQIEEQKITQQPPKQSVASFMANAMLKYFSRKY